MTWTRFFDMSSGGGNKEQWSHIYIEAAQKEAELIFYNRFGHNPNRVSCTCCGEDYSISEYETLQEATAHERNCRSMQRKKYAKDGWNFRWIEGTDAVDIPEGFKLNKSFGQYITLEKHLQSPDILIIKAEDISPNERKGTLPEQGYVWVD